MRLAAASGAVQLHKECDPRTRTHIHRGRVTLVLGRRHVAAQTKGDGTVSEGPAKVAHRRHPLIHKVPRSLLLGQKHASAATRFRAESWGVDCSHLGPLNASDEDTTITLSLSLTASINNIIATKQRREIADDHGRVTWGGVTDRAEILKQRALAWLFTNRI